MKDIDQQIEQKLEDDKTLNEVSYDAQKAILDGSMSGFRKDFIVEQAVGKILEIAERRSVYVAPLHESFQVQEPKQDYDERPEVISEINGYMGEDKVEEIAEGL